MKKISFFTDIGFWSLLLWNLFLVYYQLQHPETFKTILWIYWAQSVLIGLFNFLDIITLQKVIPGSWNEDGKSVSDSKAKGCAAFFFLFHYGFFHLVYIIFLFAFVKAGGQFDFNFFLLSTVIFFMSLLITFIQRKTKYAKVPGNIGQMFMLPYLRIIPMHLTILLPAFIGVSAFTLFTVLKTLVDVFFYLITTRAYRVTATVNTD
ncbi:MAG: hypothetical protein EKK37_01430 [Sphingobacteriales bacterium]|nr:MAG: hypothetical protein EKK37_01430 [Sphingobacteriales bacterium]